MKNKALTVPFVLWAMIFIVVPLVMIVWYGVTIEEPIPYTEHVQADGSVILKKYSPVGELSQGVIRCYKAFLKADMKDVSLKLYPKLRHEIMLEVDRD